MPPRSSRSHSGKSQHSTSPNSKRARGGPRSARSTSTTGDGVHFRRASVTASTSHDDQGQASDDDDDEHNAIQADNDHAPLVDSAGKQQQGGRKRHDKLSAPRPPTGGAKKWSVALVIVAVLAAATTVGYWYFNSGATGIVSSQHDAASAGGVVQPSPAVQVPEPAKQPLSADPIAEPEPVAPAKKAEDKENPKAPTKKPSSNASQAGAGAGGGMQVHPEPVPQPRFAHSSWDYCEAPVMLPKPGPGEPNEATHSLQHVFIFARHGDRTPTTWPVASANFSATPGPNSHSVTPLWSNCDPVIVTSRTGTKRYPIPQWPGTCVLGQLTRLGAHQLNRLGRFYGQHYRSLVRTRNIRIKSTDFNRTIASAVHFAMGLYAPQRLPLPPVQLVETQHPSEDPLSLSNPKLTNTIFDFFDPTDLLAGRHGLPKLMAFGNQAWTERNLGRLFDMVATARCHDITLCLPEALPVGHGPGPCLSPVVMDRLITWAGKQFMRVSREFARATGGRALRELVVEGRANPGLSLFATHDTTIAVVLRALDVTVDVWPAYASQIVVEKWMGKEESKEGEVKYRVLYNGKNVCKGKGKCSILYE